MDGNWIKVRSTDQLLEANLIIAKLKDHDIEAILLNKQDSAYVIIGQAEVFVQEGQVEQALSILEAYDLNPTA